VIHHGDCLDVMAALDPESVSAVVTDPPYGLGFMGKAWDRLNHEWPALAYAVAKPGAHLLAFGGTRTYHRLASAVEDAGWEIRDCFVWGYASGFPKSHNLDGEWDGWGTALKPAWEPIVMARKPLRGTVAANVREHGTGALNIDGARIPFVSSSDAASAAASAASAGYADSLRRGTIVQSLSIGRENRDGTEYEGPDERGRWPANVVLTDPIFDGGIEGVVGGGETTSGLVRAGSVIAHSSGDRTTYGDFGGMVRTEPTYGDSGTYSRFFLIPKADRAEREPVGLRSFDQRRETAHRRTGDMNTPYLRGETMRRNTHPTVKPVDLMRHLVRLVTPPGGTVLDPFLGSGTTAIACEMEGFPWIGIEREAEYVAIAEARLVGVQRGMGLSA
jgi:site-specific DNA-methyltransferase (adenine-specific)